MIASLRGTLIHKEADAVVIEVGGVGYEVALAASHHADLPEAGHEVFLHIYTAVREDAISLYGFLSSEERKLFLLLISVSGVGPKLALNVLSGATPAELARAIIMEDIGRLKKLPGVGKKTAERLCLELKDRMPSLGTGEAQAPPAAMSLPEEARVADALSALVNLGYPRAAARTALDTVRQQLGEEAFPGLRLEELIRYCLRSLA